VPVDIKKALGQTQAGTVLVDKEIDKTIQHLVEYKNPIRVNLPRKQGSGAAWYVNRRSAGSTLAAFVSDTDTITEDTGTYVQVAFSYKTIATQGRVTRFMQAIGRSYTDVLAEEIEAKARDFRDYEEWALIKGSVSTSSKQFDGLDILIPSSQAVGMTTASGGSSLTLAKMDEAIDKCVGEPDMIAMSKRSRRELGLSSLAIITFLFMFQLGLSILKILTVLP
jgi:HK97 family phage major capsid protein